MNLFKILANGHGSVSETNVSAFLGYLLDPNADHGLGYEFLNLFLGEVITDEDRLKELYQYDYQVFFEQKFKESTIDKSETIDICLLCYETKDSGKSMSIMTDFISNNKEIKKVFLIENKIKGNPTKNQLSKQFLAFKEQFLTLKPKFEIDNIHSIYITPETTSFNNEFENNTDEITNKTHLHWSNNDDENNSIKNLLQQILIDETNFRIDPLNQYAKHTIKAFIQFINSGFKSVKQEKSDRKNDGSYTKRYIDFNKESKIKEKLDELRIKLLNNNPKLKISEPDLSEPRFPKLNIYYNGLIIELFTSSVKREFIKLIFRIDNSKEYSRSRIVKLAQGLEVNLKKEKYRTTYCYVEDMKKRIYLNNFDEIFSAIEKAKKLIDENL